MQPIDTAFDEGRFSYTQLERHGDIAIYEQQHKENPKVVRFEVIRIRVQPEHTWPSGQTTPEREAYPGASVWGRLGFTYFSSILAVCGAMACRTCWMALRMAAALHGLGSHGWAHFSRNAVLSVLKVSPVRKITRWDK
jgi:hypothetical protein